MYEWIFLIVKLVFKMCKYIPFYIAQIYNRQDILKYMKYIILKIKIIF